MTIMILWLAALTALVISFFRSRKKTAEGLKKGVGIMKGMAYQILMILAAVALIFSLIPEEWIAAVLGSEKTGTIWGALLGTITIIPGIVAFPLAGELENSGASLSAISAFITTLTMVGLATLPVEIKHFGKGFALFRNGLSLLAAVVIALIMGGLL